VKLEVNAPFSDILSPTFVSTLFGTNKFRILFLFFLFFFLFLSSFLFLSFFVSLSLLFIILHLSQHRTSKFNMSSLDQHGALAEELTAEMARLHQSARQLDDSLKSALSERESVKSVLASRMETNRRLAAARDEVQAHVSRLESALQDSSDALKLIQQEIEKAKTATLYAQTAADDARAEWVDACMNSLESRFQSVAAAKEGVSLMKESSVQTLADGYAPEDPYVISAEMAAVEEEELCEERSEEAEEEDEEMRMVAVETGVQCGDDGQLMDVDAVERQYREAVGIVEERRALKSQELQCYFNLLGQYFTTVQNVRDAIAEAVGYDLVPHASASEMEEAQKGAESPLLVASQD
jgi:hypothetical protein